MAAALLLGQDGEGAQVDAVAVDQRADRADRHAVLLGQIQGAARLAELQPRPAERALLRLVEGAGADVRHRRQVVRGRLA